MGQNDQGHDSLGRAKSPRFRSVLLDAIKETYGSSKRFAEHAGMSEGRVSQMLSGKESLTAESLERVLRAFSDLGHQEAIYRAWIETFVPMPLQLHSDQTAQEQAYRLLESKDSLITQGLARQTLSAIEGLRPSIDDAEYSFKLLRASIELSLYLGRSAQARNLSQLLVKSATKSSNLRWIGRGLWLSASVARTDPWATAKHTVDTHERVAGFITAWSPTDSEDRDLAVEMKRTIARDRVLTVLALGERREVDSDELKRSNDRLRNRTTSDLPPDTLAVNHEVLARGYLALGDRVGAEDSLEEAKRVSSIVSFDHLAKVQVLKARFLLGGGLPHEAEQELTKTLTTCYDLDNLHHAGRIERLLAQIPGNP